ncbi:MAG: antibiotic biosynthesis monooxygenase [Deltaproteobacteria bacterium]|nr:antibiotic biosynthesis monooxygenase [Deltaproteobacteria bacterium]
MIRVVATIRLKPGNVSDYLKIVKANVVNVREESGCVEYAACVDTAADLQPQNIDENVVTIIEKWESLEALHNHLKTPHMLAYRETVKDIVESVSLKVLKEV